MEEELRLDLGPALASIRGELTAAIESVPETLRAAFGDALTAIVGDFGAAAQLAREELDKTFSVPLVADAQVDVDTSQVDAIPADLAAAGGTVDATVDVDSTQVVSAADEVKAIDGETAQVTIEVDSSQIDDAVGGLGDLTASATGAGAASNSAAVDVGGLALASKGLSGTFTELGGSGVAAAAGIAAPVGAIGLFVDEALKGQAATHSFELRVGDLAETLRRVDVAGLNTSLQDLSVKVGANVDNMQLAIAKFVQLSQGSVVTRQHVGELGQELSALASYLSVTNPQLGAADQILQRLPTTLARPAFLARQFGISLSAAEVQTRAFADTGKTAAADLTVFEKSAAALEVVMERLGPSIASGIDSGAGLGEVRLRGLREQIRQTIRDLGTPLIDPVVASLQAGTAGVQGFAEGTAKIATAAASIIVPAFEAIAIAGKGVGAVVGAIPAPLLTAGVAAFAAAKSYDLLAAGYGKITGLASGAVEAIRGIGVAEEFAGAQTTVAAARLEVARARQLAANHELLVAESELVTVYGTEGAETGVLAAASDRLTAAQLTARAAAQGVTEAETALVAVEGSRTELQARAIAATEARVAAEEQLQIVEAEAVRTGFTVEAFETATAQARLESVGAIEAETVALENLAVAEEGASSAFGPLGLAIAAGVAAFAFLGRSQSDSAKYAKDFESAAKQDVTSLTDIQTAAIATAGTLDAVAAGLDNFGTATQNALTNALATTGQKQIADAGISLKQLQDEIRGTAQSSVSIDTLRQSLIILGAQHIPIDDVARSTKALTGRFEENGATVAQTLAAASPAIDALGTKYFTLAASQRKTIESQVELVRSGASSNTESSVQAAEALKLSGAYDGLDDSTRHLIDQLLAKTEADKKGAASTAGVSLAVDKGITSIDQYQSSLGNVGREMASTTSAAAELTASLNAQNEAAKLVRDAFNNATTALSGYLGLTFDAATQDLNSHIALDKLDKSITDTTKSKGASAVAVTKDTALGRENLKTLLDQAKAQADLAVTNIKNGEGVEASLGTYQKQIDALYNVESQTGLTRAAFDAYLTEVGLTPKDVTTAVHTQGVDAAAKDFGKLQTDIDTARKAAQIYKDTLDGVATSIAAIPGVDIGTAAEIAGNALNGLPTAVTAAVGAAQVILPVTTTINAPKEHTALQNAISGQGPLVIPTVLAPPASTHYQTIPNAMGNVYEKRYAAGGEDHVAQIATTQRVWAEPETGGEAYIPLSPLKRGRSKDLLATVAHDFGYDLVPSGAARYAAGDVMGGQVQQWDDGRMVAALVQIVDAVQALPARIPRQGDQFNVDLSSSEADQIRALGEQLRKMGVRR